MKQFLKDVRLNGFMCTAAFTYYFIFVLKINAESTSKIGNFDKRQIRNGILSTIRLLLEMKTV